MTDMALRIFTVILTIIMSIALNSIQGVAMEARPAYKEQIKEKLKNIIFSDGVSKEEAIIIAQNYLLETEWGKSCNLKSAEVFGENDPYWDKDSWHISFKLTYKERVKSGLKWTILNVDKKTGKVTPGGEGPS